MNTEYRSLTKRWHEHDPLTTVPIIILALLTLVLAVTSVVSTPAARAAGFPIGGKILEEYNQAGGAGFFGDAITREANAARNGKFQKFAKNSSIYWHPNVSNGHAQQIGGSIRDKWLDLGFENGFLRYPTTRELATRVSGGRFNRFEGGNIYYSQDGGTHPVYGAILAKWGELDYEAGFMGFPVGDEFAAKDGGRGQKFQGGSIYWSSATGAHTVYGLIGQNWADNNFENGDYGYPISDEFADSGYEKGRRQNFQGGYIAAADMTVPYEGYTEPGTDARARQQAPSSAPGASAPSESSTPASPPAVSPTAPATTTESPAAPTPDATAPAAPPSSTPMTSTPTSLVEPAAGSGSYTPGGSLIVRPATFPFGDFCIFGTRGGPGGACRGGFSAPPFLGLPCAAAVAWSAASLLIAPAKILKIRKFLRLRGGVKEAINLWGKSMTSEGKIEAWEKTGQISREIIAEFVGLPGIAAAC